MVEIDVIDHLLERESQAEELFNEAQLEADKHLSEAHAKAEADYKARYTELVAALELDYQKQSAHIGDEHRKRTMSYQESLQSLKIDTASFNALLDTLFAK
ncbi:MAG: hypothetical protein Ta2A_27010 [Treponemataceae bacterium]|nr:MAG: hypothetical protein Ta2A_27010 [Treponemataceae bacterium]